MALTVVRLARSDVARVAHLQLPSAQRGFVGPMEEMTADDDPLQDFFAVEHADEVVGFFKIDRDFSRIDERLSKGSHGMRGLLIGGQYQRRGLGGTLLATLPDTLQTFYPDVDVVYLRVDAANAPAIRAYEASGWALMAGPDVAGRSGPEKLMKLEL